MSLRRCLIGTGLMCALVFGVSSASAQEQKQQGHDQKGQQADDAEMQPWMELSTPGPEHERLKYAIGEWKATTKQWMDPKGEPVVGSGTEVHKAVLGGRFIMSEFHGEFMGQPFTGIGYTGYDRIQKKYVSNWMDSMGTQISTYVGDYDEATKTYTYHGDMLGMSGETIKSKLVDKITGPDSHVFTMYSEMPGQEGMVKIMEISYERVGKASAKAD